MPKSLALLLLMLACDDGGDKANPTDDTGPDTPPDDSTPTDDSTPDNTAPTAPEVSIDPATPGDGDPLTVTVLVPSEDPDGNTVTYRYAWTQNGVDAGSTTSISADLTASGDTWSVSVYPSDGIIEGEPGLASVTIAANQPPVAPVIRLEPAEPAPGDTVVLTIDNPGSDPDGDTLTQTITWTIDGAYNPALDEVMSIDGEFVDAGEIFGVTVSVDDGHNPPVSASASVTVSNTPPEIRALSISPSVPEDEDDLLARYGVDDPDDDPVTVTLTWYRDGAVASDAGATSTVPAELTTVGEVWEVEVSASDGAATTVQRSSPVTIEAGSTAYYVNSLRGVLTDDGTGAWSSFSGTWSLQITTTGPEYGDMDCANSWAVVANADSTVCPRCDFAFAGDVTSNGLSTSSGAVCTMLDADGTVEFSETVRGASTEFDFETITGPMITLANYYYRYGPSYAEPVYWSAQSGYAYYSPDYSMRSDVLTYDSGGATMLYAVYEIRIGY